MRAICVLCGRELKGSSLKHLKKLYETHKKSTRHKDVDKNLEKISEGLSWKRMKYHDNDVPQIAIEKDGELYTIRQAEKKFGEDETGEEHGEASRTEEAGDTDEQEDERDYVAEDPPEEVYDASLYDDRVDGIIIGGARHENIHPLEFLKQNEELAADDFDPEDGGPDEVPDPDDLDDL